MIMNKFLCSLLLGLAVLANANDVLNISTQCNNGSSGSNQYNQPKIGAASCYLTAVSVTPGFDLRLQNESCFFFDSGIKFPGSELNSSLNLQNQSIPIRFVIFEDEKEYNSVQAIVQTAYATRTPVLVIFANPKIKLYELNTFMGSKRKTEKNCYIARDLNNAVTSINCPIQSIQLGAN